MRYIDADRLIKLLKEQKVKETGAYTKGINSGLNVAKCIINDNTVQSPIAYDVEKVVEQIENAAYEKYRTQYGERKRCLEIVKQGGVSDDVCEWKQEDDNLITSCGDYFNILDNCTEKFDFCPKCGKKIKVVE